MGWHWCGGLVHSMGCLGQFSDFIGGDGVVVLEDVVTAEQWNVLGRSLVVTADSTNDRVIAYSEVQFSVHEFSRIRCFISLLVLSCPCVILYRYRTC